MSFNSFAFAGLMLVTFVCYYLPFFSKWQIYIFIFSGFAFYAFSQPYLLFLLLLFILVNTVVAHLIAASSRLQEKRTWAMLGIILDLCVLIIFKYAGLFAKTFLNSSGSPGEFLMQIPLPLGI